MTRDFLIEGRDGPFSPLEEEIIEALKTVYDPEIPIPIWDLGLVYGMDTLDSPTGAEVHIRMTLTAPNCPAAETLPAEVEQKVNALESVRTAEVEIVFTPTFSMEMLTDEAKLTLGLI